MKRKKSRVLAFVILSVTMLIFSSVIDYSFFIMFVTAATIYLGLTIYGIAFYSREFTKGSNYLYIGIAYLAISILDLMGILNGIGVSLMKFDINNFTQLWFVARFIEGFVLFHAYSKLIRKRDFEHNKLFIRFGITTLLLYIFIALNNFMPIFYYPETGYTLYKKVLDVIVILLYIAAMRAIYKNESRIFNKRVLIIAILFKIFGEFVFIFDDGESNIFGMIIYMSKYISYEPYIYLSGIYRPND